MTEYACGAHIRGRLDGPYNRGGVSEMTTIWRSPTAWTWRRMRSPVTRDYYRYSVVNNITGERLASGDAFGLAGAMDACGVAVHIARGALFYGFSKPELERVAQR